MKKRKFIGAIAATALSAAMLFGGCAKQENTMIFVDINKNVTDVTRISFYGFKYNESDLVAIEKSIHNFMDVHPDINVNYEGIINNDKADNFYEIFDLRLNSGHLDDVFMIQQDARMESMLESGTLLDLKDVIALDEYTDLVKSQIVYPGGSIYFVPMVLAAYGFYVNYDLLNSDGQKVPTNFEELTSVCEFYKNKYSMQGKKLAPIICNNKRSLRTIVQAYGTYDLYQLPKKQNEDVIDSYNDKATRKPLAEDYLYGGLEFAKNMLDNGWIDAEKTLTTVQTNADSGDMSEFMKCEQPFMITGAWATNRITDKIEKEGGKKFNYGVHPFPFLSKEKGGSVLLYDVNICVSVNAKSKNLDAAKEFISFFTDPDSVWEYCNTNNSYSPVAKENRKPDNKTLVPHLDYYTNGQSVLGTNYRIYGFNLNDAIDGATNELLGGGTIEAAKNRLLAGMGLSEE